MESAVLVTIVVAIVVIAVGIAGYVLMLAPYAPAAGAGTGTGEFGGTQGSILGPFQRNNPDIQPPVMPD